MKSKWDPSHACLTKQRHSMQAEQRVNTSAVQSAMSHALQHVPLINQASTGDSTQVFSSVTLPKKLTGDQVPLACRWPHAEVLILCMSAVRFRIHLCCMSREVFEVREIERTHNFMCMSVGVCIEVFLHLVESYNDALLASSTPQDSTTVQDVVDFVVSDSVALSIVCGPTSYVFFFAWHHTGMAHPASM